LVSYLFPRVEFPNARPPKRETPAHDVGGSGHRAERIKGDVLKQESVGMILPDILLAKPKRRWVKGERTPTVIEGRWIRWKGSRRNCPSSLNKSAKAAQSAVHITLVGHSA
jgi:hypothetical protein